MAADKESADRFEALRAQAEALIRERLGDTPQTKSDIVELIHELQIQKGELEIQNEELRRVQEESNRLAREWQATFDADNDAVWILDHDQRVLRANKMAEVFFDLTKNEMIGKSCWEIVHGTNKPIPECPCLRSKKSLRRESMELQIGDAWFQISTDPILDADGRFNGVVHVVRDITQRKKTEIELERTLDATTDGIWSWKFKTNELFFSSKYYTMLGYEPKAFPANYENWVKLIHPDDREKALADANEYLETKQDYYENEFRLRTKDGGYRWIHSKARVAERDEHGEAVYMIGNHEDITDRKEAEHALRKSEEKFRGVYQQSPIAIEIYDAEGLMIDANPQCLKLFGINELDEVKDFKLFDDPNLPRGAKEDLREGISIHYEHEFDFDLVRDKRLYETSRSGKAFISAHITPLFHPNNELSGYLVQVEDITERKWAEKALRDSETYFREITENASDIIVIVDEKGIILYTSPSVERFLGYRPEELAGKNILDVIHSDDTKRAVKDFADAVQSDTTPIPNSFRVLHKDGSERVLEGLGKNLLHHPIVSGFIMNIHDVTESRRLQSQIQHAQKMEAIATLTGGIAHDYNNLLSVIMGNLGLARQDAKPGSDQAEFLIAAEKAARKVGDLTHELMALSRGGGPVKELGSIGETLNRATREVPPDSAISLEQSLADDLWPVPHDARKMGAVFRNVFQNAVEAMPDGGTLTVRAENRHIDGENGDAGIGLKPGDYVHIALEDKGKGIPEEHLPKLFDPYFSTKPMGVQKGMGLGLATAHAIVKGHGGEITVQSTPDVGTTVSIYLPAQASKGTEEDGKPVLSETQPTVADQQAPMRRVLLMDDEEMLRSLAKQMLNRLGYKVETVKDGIEAIEVYKKQLDSAKPFDAVILDLTIKGGMGGEEVLKELLKMNPDVKAIVASGYFNDPVMEEFQDYGFKGAMAKPYEMKDIREALEKVL